jgi:2-oxoisovalerate dehydrogenase E1 component
MNAAFSRYPVMMTKEEFLPVAYRWMYLSRKLEERIIELYKKRYVKGTVTLGIGNEATAVGMVAPLRPKKDVLALMQRDFASHMIMGETPYSMLCQYMANADSPTHGREGNVHHGNAHERRFPMISHLSNMLSLIVGGTWSARKNGEDAFGLAVIGDGGSSKGEFHESVNIASVRKAPVLFLIQNNHYSYSTPTKLQYACEKLSDRAAGYAIKGKTVDGTDVWEVYAAVCEALGEMSATSMPYIIECMTLRLEGHAVYDKAEYVSKEERDEWLAREPLARARRALFETRGSEADVSAIERAVEAEVDEAVRGALKASPPDPAVGMGTVFAEAKPVPECKPFSADKVKFIGAVTLAQDYILANDPSAVLMGLDIGPYGSAFKTCKGLFDKYGMDRVMDMPLAESAITGFALGASQTGSRPIIEFQFADFSTESVTQLGLNAGTWYFRSGKEAPLLVRLPCGGGITLGAFHSGEFDGLWSRFCGLKLLYPFTPQEMFEALVAGFYDPNPCLVFEHKLLYGSAKGTDIRFDGDLSKVWRERRYASGTDCTVVGIGAMLDTVLAACKELGASCDVFNPFILNPLAPERIMESVKKTGRLCVVQENTASAGIGDRIVSAVSRECFSYLKAAPVLVSSPDTPVPFAAELEAQYRPGGQRVKEAITKLTGEKK